MISDSGRMVKDESACTLRTNKFSPATTITSIDSNWIGIFKRQRVIPLFKFYHTFIKINPSTNFLGEVLSQDHIGSQSLNHISLKRYGVFEPTANGSIILPNICSEYPSTVVMESLFGRPKLGLTSLTLSCHSQALIAVTAAPVSNNAILTEMIESFAWIGELIPSSDCVCLLDTAWQSRGPTSLWLASPLSYWQTTSCRRCFIGNINDRSNANQQLWNH